MKSSKALLDQKVVEKTMSLMQKIEEGKFGDNLLKVST